MTAEGGQEIYPEKNGIPWPFDILQMTRRQTLGSERRKELSLPAGGREIRIIRNYVSLDMTGLTPLVGEILNFFRLSTIRPGTRKPRRLSDDPLDRPVPVAPVA